MKRFSVYWGIEFILAKKKRKSRLDFLLQNRNFISKIMFYKNLEMDIVKKLTNNLYKV